MKEIILLCFLAVIPFSSSLAQKADTLIEIKSAISPPIPIEVFAGNKGFVFQMLINKNFSSPSGRFGFFNVTSFVGDYATENQKNSFMSQSFLTAHIWKGISVNSGVIMNSMTGFRPSAGIQYVFVDKRFTLVVLPRFDLSMTYNFEALGLMEFKPKFTRDWGLYTRIQGVYNHNVKMNMHDRSYVRLRIGPSYKNYQFGLGVNVEFYGPQKIHENSFGPFVQAVLF